MAVVLQKLTVDDLETFPDNGYRYEIIDGDLTMSPAPVKKHQRLLLRLSRLFDDAARSARIGEVFFSPVDVRFTEFDQVQPDLIYIRNERAGIYQASTVNGAPDIVLEVLSPSTRKFDEIAKFRLFQTHRVPEYWIVDPESSSIRQFVLTDGTYMQARYDEGQPMTSSILAGLAIDPVALFLDSDD